MKYYVNIIKKSVESINEDLNLYMLSIINLKTKIRINLLIYWRTSDRIFFSIEISRHDLLKSV